MNTHESYVSLETAKMLKKAGFDWGCEHCYFNDEFDEDLYEPDNFLDCTYQIAAPTLASAQRWLREVKGYIVEVLWFKKDFDYQGMVIEDEHYRWISSYPVTFQIEGKDVYDILHDKDGKNYSTYEEAQEAGIKKVLEIILEKGL